MSKNSADWLIDLGAFILVMSISYPIIARPKDWTGLSSILFDLGLIVGISMVARGVANGTAIRVAERLSLNNDKEKS